MVEHDEDNHIVARERSGVSAPPTNAEPEATCFPRAVSRIDNQNNRKHWTHKAIPPSTSAHQGETYGGYHMSIIAREVEVPLVSHPSAEPRYNCLTEKQQHCNDIYEISSKGNIQAEGLVMTLYPIIPYYTLLHTVPGCSSVLYRR